MAAHVSLFKKLDLDVLIHVTNASGLSAYNPIERRFAWMSAAMAGVVLPHDIHGTHLDSAGNTIDPELAKKIFESAGLVACDVWNKTKINGYKVDCKWKSVECKFIPEEVDQSFVAAHVRQTRYGIQIVRCLIPTCCGPFRSNWMEIIKTRFYEVSRTGQKAVEPSRYFNSTDKKKIKFAKLKQRLISNHLPEEAANFAMPPFDLYCPSMQKKLAKCICETCGVQWPCEAQVKRHKKCHKNEMTDDSPCLYEVTDEFCKTQDEDITGNPDKIPIIDNLVDFMASDFEFITRNNDGDDMEGMEL